MQEGVHLSNYVVFDQIPLQKTSVTQKKKKRNSDHPVNSLICFSAFAGKVNFHLCLCVCISACAGEADYYTRVCVSVCTSEADFHMYVCLCFSLRRRGGHRLRS